MDIQIKVKQRRSRRRCSSLDITIARHLAPPLIDMEAAAALVSLDELHEITFLRDICDYTMCIRTITGCNGKQPEVPRPKWTAHFTCANEAQPQF